MEIRVFGKALEADYARSAPFVSEFRALENERPRKRDAAVHSRMIETFSFSAFAAFCESVCRLKTVEIQLDVEFSTSADSLTRRIWLWLAFPECHCRC